MNYIVLTGGIGVPRHVKIDEGATKFTVDRAKVMLRSMFPAYYVASVFTDREGSPGSADVLVASLRAEIVVQVEYPEESK